MGTVTLICRGAVALHLPADDARAAMVYGCQDANYMALLFQAGVRDAVFRPDLGMAEGQVNMAGPYSVRCCVSNLNPSSSNTKLTLQASD